MSHDATLSVEENEEEPGVSKISPITLQLCKDKNRDDWPGSIPQYTCGQTAHRWEFPSVKYR